MKDRRHQPPAWVEKILRRLLTDRQLEVSLGDLEEKYDHHLAGGMSRHKANLKYILEGLGFIRMATRNRIQHRANSFDMLRNYITIAWRTLIRERGYTLINLLSLSIAIAFLALVTLYLRHEFSFDRFHSRTDSIFRLSRTTYETDGSISEHDPYLPAPLGPAIAEEYPQVSRFTRMMGDQFLIRAQENLFQESGAFVDPSFLTMFDFPLQYGNPSTAIKGINDVVLSETLAAKLFAPGKDPVGSEIEINVDGAYRNFTVTAIARDAPSNSTIRFDLLLNLQLYLSGERGRRVADNWYSSFLQTYVLMHDASGGVDLQSHLLEFRRKHYPNEVRELMTRRLWEDSTKAPATYHLQNLADIHNEAGFPDSVTPQKYYNLGGIALMVLILGCFNFMLLSLGKARRRALEIGMRKTLGARRGQVVIQFWSESLLTSLVGMIIGIGLMYLAIPVFNQVVETNLAFIDIFTLNHLAMLTGIGLLTGFLAGFYPSLVLSAMQPVRIMQQRTEMKSSWFSKSLITVQFGLSVFFILLALVVATQIQYVKDKDLGITTEGIVRLSVRGATPDRVETLKKKLESYSFVRGTSSLRFRFPVYTNQQWSHEGKEYRAYLLDGDRDMTDMFGLQLVSGKLFSLTEPDTANVIMVNESLASAFGGEDLVGKRLPGYSGNSTVIGIIRNFNFQSLENAIQPMIISINPVNRGSIRPRTTLLVKIDLENSAANLQVLEREWKTLLPELPFSYGFLREDLHAEYAMHERWSMLVLASSCMAVFIACLGLVGFSTLHVNSRLREIGVRKVFGSSSLNIFLTFARQFLTLVVAGSMLALPFAWMEGHRWLESFAYRTELTWMLFASGILLAVILALAVVSYLFMRISRLNPIAILRTE